MPIHLALSLGMVDRGGLRVPHNLYKSVNHVIYDDGSGELTNSTYKDIKRS